MSIRKIAKLSGTSTTTVSRVINNHPYVSDELRDKVLTIMKEIDYIPNRNAINLSNGESDMIGLVVPYTRNSCYDQLVEGILEEATKQQKKVLMLPTYFNKELENEYYTLLRDKTVDGIIVTSKTHDDQFLKDLSRYGPIVTTEKTTIDSIPAVYPDREEMYHTVFSHIKKLTDVKHIFMTVNRTAKSSLSTRIKTNMFKDYFPDVSISKALIPNIFNYEDGYRLGKELFTADTSQTVIYCNGDEIAAGIFQAAKEYNLVMNQDFYLIGEDNQLLSLTLGIDSVDFNLKYIGAKAVTHLITNSSTREKVACEFIERNNN
ncbi:LacI family DNA-binding transcriptional regulator [Vagococcus fluvialis]|uniref:LacI family DNA-binding transcriptional regulator n=1 Tax=Vagococcus fluvialis TaxID=2738 RepID=UPI003B5AF956